MSIDIPKSVVAKFLSLDWLFVFIQIFLVLTDNIIQKTAHSNHKLSNDQPFDINRSAALSTAPNSRCHDNFTYDACVPTMLSPPGAEPSAFVKPPTLCGASSSASCTRHPLTMAARLSSFFPLRRCYQAVREVTPAHQAPYCFFYFGNKLPCAFVHVLAHNRCSWNCAC